MKKIAFSFLMLVCLWGQSFSQSFYETHWAVDGTDYAGFLVYYDDNDAFMRVNYEVDGELYVADYNCYGEYLTDSDLKGFMIIGDDAEVLNGDHEYDPNVFIFLDEGEGYGLPMIISVLDIEREDFENYLIEANSWEEISPDQINSALLDDYFFEDEAIFDDLLALGKGGSEYYGGEEQDYDENYAYVEPAVQEQPEMAMLNLVMVANTAVSDIGESCDTDRKLIIREFGNIAKALDIPFKKTEVYGNNYSKKHVDDALNNLSTGPNDIVVFWYSGHGFRWSDQASQYSTIDLTASNYEEIGPETSYSMEEIFNILTSKNGRLKMVFADCCNNDIGIKRLISDKESAFGRNQTPRGEVNRLKALFLESNGNLIINASAPGETAGCDNQGGYFTVSFFNALNKEVGTLNSTSPSWDNIINTTKENANYKKKQGFQGETQRAVFKSTLRQE